MAIGALSALCENQLRVPDDMAVAGFDDIPMARYMNPPLSSVHVEISALGAQATEMLLDRIERKDGVPRLQRILPTRLVIRHSCGGLGPRATQPAASADSSSRSLRRQAP
jgi:LacI family transcriptional regulator